MSETHELLRAYVENRSERAFQEIVRRYIDLVYSTALRRMHGDVHRAEDVMQTVFTDLARKAEALPREVMLGGWLHRHCCFVASTMNRSEVRRHAREKEAMNFVEPNEPSRWEDVAPVLDDAIQELDEPERNVITLRYFERRDLRAVGGLFGISEDAAQKRVSRALEKLRGLLAKRGVAFSGLALGALLEARSIEAAPSGLVERMSSEALSGRAASVASVGTVAGLLSSGLVKLAALALVVAAIGTAMYRQRASSLRSRGESTRSGAAVRQDAAAIAQKDANGASDFKRSASAASSGESAAQVHGIRIHVLSKETGDPIKDGSLELRGWEEDKFVSGRFVTDSEGFCTVAFRRDRVTEVEITTRIPAFADTRLSWAPKRGEKIPEEYTLQLERGVPIGGTVINDRGDTVAGAKVGFNHNDRPELATEVESHLFSWIEVETDSTGRWRIDRIAADMLRTIYGSASHPDYVRAASIDLKHDSSPEAQLRAGTYVFRLNRAVTITGFVLDEQRNPVPGASVLVGERGEVNSRSGTAGLDGSFELAGVPPGKNHLTGQAAQFAPRTIEITAESNSPPYEIVLGAGHVLKMRVVNKAGEPLPNATIWLDTRNGGQSGISKVVQAEFQGKTDADGRVYWGEAPEGKLSFDIEARGYARRNRLVFEADGSEHVVVLNRGLRIYGTVRDAVANSPIARFKITEGTPSGAAGDTIFWSQLGRYTLSFVDGAFDYRLEEPVIYGTGEWKYVFKVMADGYAPFITRVVDAREEEAQFNIALTPAPESKVTLLEPDGQPAADASVSFVSGGGEVRLAGDTLENNGGGVISTDSQGQISWQPDESAFGVYAVSREGFATLKGRQIPENRTIPLEAWGRVEGIYRKSGRPVAGAKLSLAVLPAGLNSEPRLYLTTESTTDENGHFVFERVPPIQITLWLMAPNGDRSFSFVRLQEISVKPGQTSTVDYSDNGRDVIARLRWPPRLQRETGDKIFTFMSTPGPIPPKDLIGNPEGVRRWAESSEIAAQLRTIKNRPMSEQPDGSFKAESLAPGDYTFSVSVFRPSAQGEVASVHRPVTIPSEQQDEVVDLGEIDLESGRVSLEATKKMLAQ